MKLIFFDFLFQYNYPVTPIGCRCCYPLDASSIPAKRSSYYSEAVPQLVVWLSGQFWQNRSVLMVVPKLTITSGQHNHPPAPTRVFTRILARTKPTIVTSIEPRITPATACLRTESANQTEMLFIFAATAEASPAAAATTTTTKSR